MASVKEQYRQEIEEAISKAKASGERETVGAPDGGEAYAYPHRRGIAWGVNAVEAYGDRTAPMRRKGERP